MSFEDTLDMLVRRHDELRDMLARGDQLASSDFVKYSKEYADLTPIIEKINEFTGAKKTLKDLEVMIADPACDAEMKSMAEEELRDIQKGLPEMTRQVQLALLPKDAADEKNAILEVRAGTGGDEAALFAADLFRMYQRYAQNQGWRFEVMSVSENGVGGFKDASAEITGKGVFAKMKFESGVHRVQRVPETESQGRVHTSAATVAVLPEAEEVDITINESDLRIDVYRAQGAGGQHVNKTESAVRITHIPTGTVVAMQEERSQIKNRAKAMKILRSRIYENERAKLASTRAADRKTQVGSGDRSERIRTYNYPQGRVSDHRINLTLYNIDYVVNGTELDKFVEALMADEQMTKLAEFATL
ncbi:MAG: peptide chain release factor 1 [Alphaproteobacteria bacterium]|nr:peptide chain release factor 1 [Alphaproteobacteria bacterium]